MHRHGAGASLSQAARAYILPHRGRAIMLGLVSYGILLAILAGLMPLACLRGRREQDNAVAAILAARIT